MNEYQCNYRMRALEPQKMYCGLTEREVSVLFEYPDYKNRNNKGCVGTVYCENIIECYYKEIKCKYSGISALYPDPLVPKKPSEEEAAEEKPQENESAG